MKRPSRGDVWDADFSPTRGREQAGRLPALVVSTDPFNHGPAELLVVVPLTGRLKGVPLHVEVTPPEGGLRRRCWIRPEDIRSISVERLGKRWGAVSAQTLAAVETRLRVLLEL